MTRDPCLGGSILTWLAALCVGGCAAPAPTPDAAGTAHDVAQTYQLDTADHLRIIVFDEPTLSGDFEISADGSIAMPLIGSVPAAGRTTAQLGDAIRAKLAAGYLQDPRVSIAVLTYRPYYILGEVTRPGEYPYSIGLTVVDAVAKAQGFTYRANQRHIFIKSVQSQQEIPVTLTTATPVRPGDTIRIPERYF